MARLLAVLVILAVVGVIVIAVRSGPPQPGAVALDTRGTTSPAAVELPTAAATPTAMPTATAAPTSPPTPSPVPVDAPPDRGPHRALRDIDGWLQSDVTSLEELRGKVVVVEFWTFGCINCQRTLPNLIELYGSYGRDRLEFVGIHSPEFDHEAVVDNITAAAADLGVTWPIALDTRKRTFHGWQEGTRAYWPRTYVLDREGHIRFDHIGEGAYDELNDTVAALIADPTL